MVRPLLFLNVVCILTATSLVALCNCESVNASLRYPYLLPKCCETDRNQIADGVSNASGVGPCGLKESEVLLLPRQLFPQMSTELEHVEVELWSSAKELTCEKVPENSDVSIDLVDNETWGPVNVGTVGRKKVTYQVSFSGENFMDRDGNIYSPRHFCVSSRTSNKTRLVIKTCNQMCSPQHLCIPRCCGGHQSFLTSPPTSRNKSLVDFCSTPTLEKNAWNPMASNILELGNRTHFYQRRFSPHTHFGVDEELSKPSKHCTMTHVKLEDKLSLALLKDGRLKVTLENSTGVLVVLDNFCIDGINIGAGGSSVENKRDTPEEEVVVVYFCKVMELQACSDFAHPPNQIVQLPQRLFPNRTTETKDAVAARLTAGKNGELVECDANHETLTLDLESSTENYFDKDGWLVLRGVRYHPSTFCVRSVSHNSLGLRKYCRVPWLFLIIQLLPLPVSGLFYVAIAVVYILRKDKEPVLRCSIVAFSISAMVIYVLILCTVYFILNSISKSIGAIIAVLFLFFLYAFGLSWMSVLSFDVWIHITFLRPGRKSNKRVWGYIAFTFTLPSVVLGVGIFAGEKSMLALVIGFPCISFLLFIATAVKLWIAQHTSDIKNQRKTFLLYFKLFLLVGLRWVIDFLLFLGIQTDSLLLNSVAFILLLLHPIVLFFFLVWDEEAKRYLETNYPRVKRVLDLIYGIGYPVRKCWGVRRICKRPEEERTSGQGAIEPPHNSTHMYVHTRRAPNIPK